LLLAQAAIGVAREAVAIATDYERQVKEAVAAGLLFKGDELRVQVEQENNELVLRRALEQQRTAGTQLAQTLHLDPAVELGAQDSELVPVRLVETNAGLSALLAQAHALRPEPKRDQAAVAAARETRKGAVYGPLIPTAGAQFFAGGLGGSSDAGPSRFGNQEELFAGLSWKIGPGGLFDFTRRRAAEAQLRSTELVAAKTRDQISREVVDAFTRVQSLSDQLHLAQRTLEAAQEGLRLARLRREIAVGIVLENIQAEQDLTRARYQYAQSIAELNKAQYALARAVANGRWQTGHVQR
jgi:outer membrane protein TolC